MSISDSVDNENAQVTRGCKSRRYPIPSGVTEKQIVSFNSRPDIDSSINVGRTMSMSTVNLYSDAISCGTSIATHNVGPLGHSCVYYSATVSRPSITAFTITEIITQSKPPAATINLFVPRSAMVAINCFNSLADMYKRPQRTTTARKCSDIRPSIRL